MIRKHYLDLRSFEKADVFWGIVPEGEALPPPEKKDGRYVIDTPKTVNSDSDWASTHRVRVLVAQPSVP